MNYLHKRLNKALEWRLFHIKQWKYKLYWKFKKNLFLTNKTLVDSISIVIVGRNDNYRGDYSLKLKTVLDWNLQQVPNAELIYVEWNQIPNKSSDCEWIAPNYPNSKCFVVPNEIHEKICTNPNIKVLEFTAKNLGIRKASNNWILVLNSDILLEYNFALKLKKLSKKYFYGTHYENVRWDGKKITQQSSTFKDRISYFSANKKMMSAVGNFILTHKMNWYNIKGYDERYTGTRLVDNTIIDEFISIGLKPMVLGNHYHMAHQESISNGINPSHGNQEFSSETKNNLDSWGLNNYNICQIASQIYKIIP